MGLMDRMVEWLVAEPRKQQTILEQRAAAGSAVIPWYAGLLDMSPRLPVDCIADGRVSDTVTTRNLSYADSTRRKRSNLSHIVVRQLGVAGLLSGLSRISTSSLFGTIPVVVGERAGAKVRWVAAWRIVAGMHDNGSVVRDGASGKAPCNAVRAFSVMSTFAGNGEDAVAVAISGRYPRPARLGAASLIDLRPKAFFKTLLTIVASLCNRAGTGTADAFAAFQPGLLDHEGLLAPRARSLNRLGSFRLGVHLDRLLHRLIWGAVPSGVGSTATAFACLHYTKFRAVTGSLGGNA